MTHGRTLRTRTEWSRGLSVTLALIASLAFGGRDARAQATLPTDFVDSAFAGGLDFPSGFTFLPDGRVLVVEQRSARVRLFVGGALAAIDPVATLPGIVSSGGEQGLLGIESKTTSNPPRRPTRRSGRADLGDERSQPIDDPRRSEGLRDSLEPMGPCGHGRGRR